MDAADETGTPVVVRIGAPTNGDSAPADSAPADGGGSEDEKLNAAGNRRGMTGNLKRVGRPKGSVNKISKELKELLEPLDTLGIKFILSTMRDQALWKKRPEIVLQTLRLGWEYRHGKPRQPITGGDGGPIDMLMFLQQAAASANGDNGNGSQAS